MNKILIIREEIYNFFHQNDKCQKFFFDKAQAGRYATYYTSMYLLQDTTESLIVHRTNDFSSEPLMAYIEFWGVMQALFIHQDCIFELYKAVTDSQLKIENLKSRQSLRNLRNICAGHPANKNLSKTSISRTFMSRSFGKYSAITYEQWQSDDKISHPIVNLGTLIDDYADEAETMLTEVLMSMKNQWS